MGRGSRQRRLTGGGSLGLRIERWRRAGRPGKRMPEELWQAATVLSREYGAYRVSSEFGLRYETPRQRAADEAGARRDSSADNEAEFVEVEVAKLLAHGEGGVTAVEVERSDGSRLKIRVGGG